MLYRSFPESWWAPSHPKLVQCSPCTPEVSRDELALRRVLARKPKIGPPKSLLSSEERPSNAEIEEAIKANTSPGGAVGFVSDLLGR